MTLLRDLRRALDGPTPPTPAPRPVRPPAEMPARRVRHMYPDAVTPAPAEPAQAAPAFPRRPTPVEASNDPLGLRSPITDRYVSDLLARQDAIPQRSRTGTQYVHVSSLSDLCTRSYALADEEGVLLEPGVTGGHKVMWKIGRAVEAHVRDGVIASRQRQGILGRWECPCQALSVQMEYTAEPCEVCGQVPLVYRELLIQNDVYGVAGNPDLLIASNNRILVVEIKSMNKKDWDALVAPMPDHVFQAFGYYRLLQEENLPLHPMVALIYVTKDFKYGNPYKEFHVEPADHLLWPTVGLAFERAQGLVAARQARTIPERTRCASIHSTRARACPVAASCFQRD